MTSQDDIATLRVLHERGEIGDEEYHRLRRQVMWGRPLPAELVRRAQLGRLRPGQPGQPGQLGQPGQPGQLGQPGQHSRPPAPPPGEPDPRRDTGTRRPAAEHPQRGRRRAEPPEPWEPWEPREPAPWEADRWGPADSNPRTRPPRLPPPGPPSAEVERVRRPHAVLPERAGSRAPARREAGEPVRAAGAGVRNAARASGSATGTGTRRPLALPAGRSSVRRRRRRRQLTVLVSAVCVLALVGSGVWWFALRTAYVQPDVYAHGVCTTVSRWQADLARRREDLVAALGGRADLQQVRNQLVTFYQDAETRTARLSVDLARIGSPNAEGGRDYAKALRAAVARTASSFHDEAERAGNLDVSNREVFQITVQAQVSSLGERTRPILDALSARGADPPLPLRVAFDAEPTCAAYTG